MTSTETIQNSKAEFDQVIKEHDLLQKENQKLKFELAELKRLIYGAKSERFKKEQTDPLQCSLFGDQQIETLDVAPTEDIAYTRNKPSKEKKQPLRTLLPAHLPRKEEVIEPENVQPGAKRIGEEVTEILEYEPASLYVRRIVRPKYIVSTSDEQTQVAIAELPSLPIPKGNAGAGLLAYLTVSKFEDHLPFYRLAKMFKRQGVELAESTIGGWFSAQCRFLDLLYQEQKKQVLMADYLQVDESPIPVLTKDKPGATHKGYMWVYHDPIRRLVFFDYRKTRSREGPNEILSEFTGHLQTDGYSAYENLNNRSNTILLACMAHARRKFEHAKDNDKERSEHALRLIAELYAVEKQAREEQLSFDQIYELRQKEAKPVLDKIKQWMDEESIKLLPQSAIGKAMAYTLKLWPRLIRYIDDGRFQIDNNLIENTIRPLAVGRKNYLFAGSHEGAYNAAMTYSFLGTCKLNKTDPYQWFKKTLEIIADHPANRLSELLPLQ